MSQRKLKQLVQNCVVSYLTLKHVALSGAGQDQLYILEFCLKKKTQRKNSSSKPPGEREGGMQDKQKRLKSPN